MATRDLELTGTAATPFSDWYDFPGGTARVSATAFAPASLYMPDWFVVLPAVQGAGCVVRFHTTAPRCIRA